MIGWWCANTTFWGAAALVGAILAFDLRQSRRSRPSSLSSIARRPIKRRQRALATPTHSESQEPVEADPVGR